VFYSRVAEDLPGCAAFRRPRTRALAIAVWVRRSSVDHRIATHAPCHLHDPPACYHPAVQSISRRDPAASLRGALRCSWDPLGSLLARHRIFVQGGGRPPAAAPRLL